MICSMITAWKTHHGWESPDCLIRSYRIGKVGYSQRKYATNYIGLDSVDIWWYDSWCVLVAFFGVEK